jgi:hypothetical protein
LSTEAKVLFCAQSDFRGGLNFRGEESWGCDDLRGGADFCVGCCLCEYKVRVHSEIINIRLLPSVANLAFIPPKADGGLALH